MENKFKVGSAHDIISELRILIIQLSKVIKGLRSAEPTYISGSIDAYDVINEFLSDYEKQNGLSKPDIHTDIQSLKDKYPQYVITVSLEEKG